MKQETKSFIGSGILIFLALISSLFIIFSEGRITGYAIYDPSSDGPIELLDSNFSYDLKLDINIEENQTITITWTDLINQIYPGLSLRVNNKTHPFILNITPENETLEFNIEIYLSDEMTFNNIPPGLYTGLLRIDGGDIFEEIHIHYIKSGVPNHFDSELGLFSHNDRIHFIFNVFGVFFSAISDYMQQIESASYDDFFTASTDNLISFFNESYGNYTPNPTYNIGDLFLPILKVNNESNIDIKYYIDINDSLGNQETLIAVKNEEDIFNSSSNYYTLYYFTLDGEEINITQTESIVLEASNLFYFSAVQNYSITILVEINGKNETVNQTEIQVIDNLTINHSENVLFYDNSEINFDVTSARGSIINRLLYPNYNYNNTLYGIPEIKFYLNNTLIEADISQNNILSSIDQQDFSEGIHEFTINYTVSDNIGFSIKEIGLFHQVELNHSLSNDTIDDEINLTLSFNVSKLGDFKKNVEINLSLSEACSEFLALSQTSLILSNVDNSSSKSAQVKIYKQKSNTFVKQCILEYNYNVYPTAESLRNFSYSTSSIPVLFTLSGHEIPMQVDFELINPPIYIGELVEASINITNNALEDFLGRIEVIVDDKEEYSADIEILQGNSTQVLPYVSFYFQKAGNNKVRIRLYNDIYNIEREFSPKVLDNYLTVSPPTRAPRLFLNDTLRVPLQITNNNNKNASVNVVLDKHSSNVQVDSDTSHVLELGPKQNSGVVYNITAIGGGTGWISGVASVEQFTRRWNHSFNIRPGYLIDIELTDSFRSYTIKINDTLAFIVDDGCNEKLDDCKDICSSHQSACKDTCRAEFNRQREIRTECRDLCNLKDDRYDRDYCRRDCDNAFGDAEREHERCDQDCERDFDFCERDCEYDHRDCTDNAIHAELKVDETDENVIFFDLDTDRSFSSFRLNQGESRKFDLRRDNYYDTEIELSRLIHDPRNTCDVDCRDDYDTDESICSSDYDICREDCASLSDLDSRRDCREVCMLENSDCRDDARYDYDECLYDCPIIYSEYEIRIRRTAPILVNANLTINCTAEWDCGNFTECNESNQRSALCVDVNECNPDELEKVRIEDCEVEGNETIQECNRNNLGNCLNEATCISAYGYWYDDACHATRRSEPTDPDPEPVDPDPEPVDPEPTDPDLDRPDRVDDGSGIGKIIVAMIIIIIVLGLGAGGYFVLKPSLVHHTPVNNASMQAPVSKDKIELLTDYFMKQLEKGNNINYIAASLKKLGWNPEDVDLVENNIMSDPAKRQIVLIVKFALEYGVSDAQSLRQRFSNIHPDIIQQAMDELAKRKSSNLDY